MKQEVLNKLYETFELEQRDGLGGMKFDYVPSAKIIDRMNRLFKGCWSTEVMSQEQKEEFALVRVRVYVYDSETEKIFHHDGFGSGMITRYKGGTNKGQIIDIGNAYKSAETKAIKNACSRWGLGLSLEGFDEDRKQPDVYNNTASNTSFIPDIPTDSPKPAVSNIPDMPPVPDIGTDVPVSQSVTTPSIPDMPPVPDIGTDVPVSQSATMPSIPDMQQDIPPTSTGPAEGENPKPPFPSSDKKTSYSQKITDVQKVAIQGLLQLKKDHFKDVPEEKRFNKLVEGAFNRTDNLPDSVEKLSYQDAVTVIKHGNSLSKKR